MSNIWGALQGTNTKCAFVSTNSICQGIAVPPLWKHLFEKGIQIDFAYRTFKWDSESSEKAAVHCVIIGFSCKEMLKQVQHDRHHEVQDNCHSELVSESHKHIYNEDGSIEEAENINAYLIDAPNIIVEDRHEPLGDLPKMAVGSFPTDDGNLVLQAEEYIDFIKKEPSAKHFIKPYIGPDEFINGKKRYCLWLKDCNPQEILKMPYVLERIQKVREFRLASQKAQTRKRAENPTLFAEDRQPDSNYILIPRTSSERRKYLPMDFLTPNTIAGDVIILPNASLYHFGVLTSSVHMAWMRTVCGRMKSDYRYSSTLVYNNLPFPSVTDEQKNKIEKTAQAILDTRAKYPDCTLAQLYGENAYLFGDLVKAHRENDKTVMAAYGFKKDMTEAEIVGELFKMYEDLTKQK